MTGNFQRISRGINPMETIRIVKTYEKEMKIIGKAVKLCRKRLGSLSLRYY
jgi:hypothetical protein